MTEHEWRVEKKASQYPTEISIQPGLEFGLNAEVYPVVKSPTSERCIMCGGRGRETIECPFCDEHGMLCRFFLWYDGKVAGVQSIFIEGSIHPGMSRLDNMDGDELAELICVYDEPRDKEREGAKW